MLMTMRPLNNFVRYSMNVYMRLLTFFVASTSIFPNFIYETQYHITEFIVFKKKKKCEIKEGICIRYSNYTDLLKIVFEYIFLKQKTFYFEITKIDLIIILKIT